MSRLDAIHLTLCEARTLRAIMAGEGQPVSREAIMEASHGPDPDTWPFDEAIRVRIHRIRCKLFRLPIAIITHHRRGYAIRHLGPEALDPPTVPRAPWERVKISAKSRRWAHAA